MGFSSFVCFEATVPELKAASRDEAIGELVEALSRAGKIQNGDCRKIMRAVIRRENEASTGLGKGVAVPHAKHTAVKGVTAAVGRSSAGIDFSSLDKQPVYTVVLVLSPTDEPDKHLQAMETVFKHLQRDNFRKFLRQMATSEEINELLLEAEENPAL